MNSRQRKESFRAREDIVRRIKINRLCRFQRHESIVTRLQKCIECIKRSQDCILVGFYSEFRTDIAEIRNAALFIGDTEKFEDLRKMNFICSKLTAIQ